MKTLMAGLKQMQVGTKGVPDKHAGGEAGAGIAQNSQVVSY